MASLSLFADGDQCSDLMSGSFVLESTVRSVATSSFVPIQLVLALHFQGSQLRADSLTYQRIYLTLGSYLS